MRKNYILVDSSQCFFSFLGLWSKYKYRHFPKNYKQVVIYDTVQITKVKIGDPSLILVVVATCNMSGEIIAKAPEYLRIT